MTALFFAIPVSLLLVGIGVAIFFWAVNSGQYEDLDSPAYMALRDDDPADGQQGMRGEPPRSGQDRDSNSGKD